MFTDFIPNQTAESIYTIDIPNDKDCLFFDFDNTLMPWNSFYLSEQTRLFLNKLAERYRIIIATNGRSERLADVGKIFEIQTGLKKPLIKKLQLFMKTEKINGVTSVFIGDNLITDIYTANRLGMYTIKVNPIGKKEFILTKIYRVMEFFITALNKNTFNILSRKNGDI